jgi:hypothetical protein
MGAQNNLEDDIVEEAVPRKEKREKRKSASFEFEDVRD